MSEIAKLVDGILIFPSEYEKLKIIITNPTNEQLKFNLQYKDFTSDDEPIYDMETQHLEIYYEETEMLIIRHYNVMDNPIIIEDTVEI